MRNMRLCLLIIVLALVSSKTINAQSYSCDTATIEGFETGLPAGWAKTNSAVLVTPGNNNSNYAYRLEGNNKTNLDAILESPTLDMIGYTRLTITFDRRTNCAGGGSCKWDNGTDKMEVTYSLNNGSNWLIGATFSQASPNYTTEVVTIDVPGGFTNQTLFSFDFYGNSGQDYTIVDNVKYEFCNESLEGAKFEGGTLTVDAGTAFTANNITVDGGNIVVNSNSINSGSFIATGAVSSSVSNAFTYNRYIPDNVWHQISSPVVNQNVESFINDSNNSLDTWSNFSALGFYRPSSAGSKWFFYNNSTAQTFDSTFDNGKGYLARRTQAGTLSFTGDFPSITSGSITKNLSSPPNNHLWYMLANPYMSYFPATSTDINADTFLKLNLDKLDPAFQGLYIGMVVNT